MGKKLRIPACTPPKEIKLIGAFSDPGSTFFDFETMKGMPDPNAEAFYYISKSDYDCKLDPIPPAGYETHKNPDTGEPLPNCCKHHKQEYSLAKEWYEKFPACCKHHQEMAENEWFNKSDYSFLPEKIVYQLSLTEHLIRKRIDSSDWLDSISGYINHNFLCFGIYGIGLNIYLESLKRFINSPESSIPRGKAIKLTEHIEYVAKHYKYDVVNTSDCDFTLPIIERWRNEFPFELSFFTEIKNYYQAFELRVPFDTNERKFKFEGVQYSLQEEVLIGFLCDLTNELLKQMNSKTLFDTDKLTDPDRIKLELIVHQRNNELKIGYKRSYTADQTRQYLGMLEKWFEDELKFLEQIKPLIEPLKSKVPKGPPDEEDDSNESRFFEDAVVDDIFELLIGYFPKKEVELKKALKGEILDKPIFFPGKQNKLTELFRRLKYNGFILKKPTEIKNWLCANFSFRFIKGEVNEKRHFNPHTVWDILSKGRGEPSLKERICFKNVEWLPYKSQQALERESESENL